MRLKSVVDVIELTRQMSGDRSLAELERAADAISRYSKSAKLSPVDQYQVRAALSGLSSKIINHAQRVRIEAPPPPRKGERRGYMSF